LAESEDVPSTPDILLFDDDARVGGDGTGARMAEKIDSQTHNDQEAADEEARNAGDKNKLGDPHEVDTGDESQETNGEPEDMEDVTDSLDKLKEATSSNSTGRIEASEDLNEVNGGFNEIKDLSGNSEELGEMNSYNLEKLVELSLDKGLLDELKPIKVESRRRVRASLRIIEKMMSYRVAEKENGANDIHGKVKTHLTPIEEEGKTAEASHEGDLAEESYLTEKVDQEQETPGDSTSNALNGGDGGSYFPWKEELESLVRGGVPMALRGEVQLQTRFAT
jgi:hypothetical protein